MPEKKELKVTPQNLVETFKSDEAKMNALQRRMQNMQQVMNEMVFAAEALKEIQKAKKDEPIMISLGAGVYAEAKISNTKEVKSSLAGNVLATTDTGKTLKKIESELKKAQEEVINMQKEIEKVDANMQGIAAIFQESQKIQAQRATEANQPSGKDVSSVS